MAAKRFLVLGMQRSGTTVTHVCLSGHPNVSMAVDEVLPRPFFTRGLATFTGGKESFQDRKDGYRALFDLIAGARANEHTLAIGLKVAIGGAADAIDIANCLREYLDGVRIILVHRNDLVAQLGSLRRAVLSGEWHAWEGERPRSSQRIALPPEEFERYAADAVAVLAQLRSLATTHELMEFGYESDIVPGDRFGALFEFLGLPVVPMPWMKMAKVAPPPAEYIANYDELTAVQAQLSPPAPAELEQAVRDRRREGAADERPLFLGYRACESLDRGQPEEACEDFLLAYRRRREGGLDLSMQGHLCGRFETLADRPAVAAAVAQLQSEAGRYSHFRLTRAQARVAGGRYTEVAPDMVDLLLDEPRLDVAQQRMAFDLLIDALGGLLDRAGAIAAIEKLRPRYASHEGLLTLEAVLARYDGDAGRADELLRAARRIAPDYPRARALS